MERFLTQVLRLDPWGMSQSTAPQGTDGAYYTISIMSGSRSHQTKFYGECDAEHKPLFDFLHRSYPGRVLDALKKKALA